MMEISFNQTIISLTDFLIQGLCHMKRNQLKTSLIKEKYP